MRRRLPLALLILLLAPAALPGQDPDSAAVAYVVATFHAALASGDSATALGLLADDALVLESGGLETRAAYRAHHLPADIAFARGVRMEREPVRLTVRGDAAWVVARSRTSGTFRGREVDARGVELVVLTRDPEGWRIRAVHWSSRQDRE